MKGDSLDARPPRVELPLFSARARNSDPETSHAAAEEVETSGVAADQRRRCLEGVRAAPYSTAAEIARAVGLERHAPSRRLPELRDAGLVVNGPSRICAVTGRASITWRACP